MSARRWDEEVRADAIVVGAGAAGLSAALAAAPRAVHLLTAAPLGEGAATGWAQGGVAAAVGADDSPALHHADTLAAGAGLCDEEAVALLVAEGPRAIARLVDLGARLDREAGGELARGREAAHGRRRIVHAGDATGREILRTLLVATERERRIVPFAGAQALALAVAGGRVVGLLARDADGRRVLHRAPAVVLATGGIGHLYRCTTNPPEARGEGLLLAARAGVLLADLEFVQFHPTALRLPGAPPFLLSEAMRGEGGRLRNANGELFMARYDAREALAPRDVVSRAIAAEVERTGSPCVYLDMRQFGAEFLRSRFPRIYETCLRYGLNLARDMAPVHPAAHYAMGGVRTGLSGKTNLPRLFAAGEAACTGVHGANRLASNSLLEGMVFGASAGAAMREWAGAPLLDPADPEEPLFPGLDAEELRTLAWDRCGVVRHGPALEEAVERLASAPRQSVPAPGRAQFELRSMHAALELIARCALAREESRGTHYRTDFPVKRPEFHKHSLVVRDRDVSFV